MGHFYGEMRGNRGSTSRMGSEQSGFSAHIRGWKVGARVYCEYDEKNERDEVRVSRSRGSSGNVAEKLVAVFRSDGKDEVCCDASNHECDCGCGKKAVITLCGDCLKLPLRELRLALRLMREKKS